MLSKTAAIRIASGALAFCFVVTAPAITPASVVGYWIQGPGQTFGIRLTLGQGGRWSTISGGDLGDIEHHLYGSWRIVGSKLLLSEDGQKAPTFILDVRPRNSSFVLVQAYDRVAHQKDPTNTYYFFARVTHLPPHSAHVVDRDGSICRHKL